MNFVDLDYLFRKLGDNLMVLNISENRFENEIISSLIVCSFSSF